ncbi:dynamin-related protein 4C [Rosa sericea]
MGRKRKNKSSRRSKERKTRSEMGEANQDAVVPRRKIRPVINSCKEEGIEIPVPTRARDLPEIAKKIDAKLSYCLSELNFLPASISSVDEAVATFMQLVALSKESLIKILVRGEFDEYPDDKSMHGTANLAEMLNQFKDERSWLHSSFFRRDLKSNFLQSEINYCMFTQQVGKASGLAAKLAADLTADLAAGEHHHDSWFLGMFWYYVIMQVTRSVLMTYLSRYVHLCIHVESLVYNLLDKMIQRSYQWTHENYYTVNVNEEKTEEFFSEDTRLMSECNEFIHGVLDDPEKPSTIIVDGIGEIVVEGLRSYSRDLLSEAFSVRMQSIAFRKIHIETFVEGMASHLQSSVANLLDTYMDLEMFDMQILKRPHFAHLFEDMLENYPLARKGLEKRINMLKKAKEICEGIMDAYDE